MALHQTGTEQIGVLAYLTKQKVLENLAQKQKTLLRQALF